jgi:hypothetical protein
MLLEGALGELVPQALMATTVKVYEVEEASPLMVMGEEAPDAVKPPGEEVTVYVVPAPPEKLMVAVTPLTVAETLLGATACGVQQPTPTHEVPL